MTRTVVAHAPTATNMARGVNRLRIYADPDGDTKLAVDQPSLLFDRYGNPQIAEVGRELDARRDPPDGP